MAQWQGRCDQQAPDHQRSQGDRALDWKAGEYHFSIRQEEKSEVSIGFSVAITA